MAQNGKHLANAPDASDDPPFDLPEASGAPERGPSLSSRALQGASLPPYLSGLNPEQRQAVEALDGPVLVLAGAGTGKTRVLTTRIAHVLASRKAYPSQLLAVTFTNKAAREMKERVGDLVGGIVEGMPWLGTFHSIGVKILRRHAELVGLKSGFTILDTDDQIRLMKQVIEAAGLDKDRWPARQLASLIDGWKNRGLTPDKVPAGEAYRLCCRQRRAALRRLPAAPEGAQRVRLRRPAAREPAAVPGAPRRARRLPAPLPLHPRRRVPGHQYRAVPVAASCWRRARPTSAASATTISRSTAGAAPRSTTSCASRRTSPARSSFGWSATTARPGTSSPPPRASSRRTKAGSARRYSPTGTLAPRSRCWLCGTTRRKRAPLVTTSSACRRTGSA